MKKRFLTLRSLPVPLSCTVDLYYIHLIVSQILFFLYFLRVKAGAPLCILYECWLGNWKYWNQNKQTKVKKMKDLNIENFRCLCLMSLNSSLGRTCAWENKIIHVYKICTLCSDASIYLHLSSFGKIFHILPLKMSITAKKYVWIVTSPKC